MQRFTFRKEVRPLVAGLVNVMEFANLQDKGKWASGQDGVYGHAYNALVAIIKEEINREAFNAMPDFNFGGNDTWLDDVEIAITEAYVIIDKLSALGLVTKR